MNAILGLVKIILVCGFTALLVQISGKHKWLEKMLICCGAAMISLFTYGIITNICEVLISK
jgi:hypothetical protein